MSVVQFKNKIAEPSPLDALRRLVSSDLAEVDNLILNLVNNKIDLIPEISGHTISSGGKRLRPILTLASSRMCGYKGNNHIDLAASVEFIHTATLLHDDVVDESDMRRGRYTANNIWGNKESILVGDFLLGKAFQLMGNADSLEIFKILSNASVVISEGEVLQLSKTGNPDINEKDYIDIVTAKTAELFAAACEIGAVLAGEAEDKRCALRQYGLNMGIAFQITDDALDYSSKQEVLGKKIGDDFREGKITLPLLIAYNKGSEEEKLFWRNSVKSEQKTEKDLLQAISLIEKHNAIAISISKAKEYLAKAGQSFNLFADSEIKSALLLILDFIADREF